MKRGVKILIAVIVVLAAVGGYFFLQPPKSPPRTTEFSGAGLDITVKYSQPSKRGRLIFGDKKDNALQPFGQYWRLGANAATEITFSKNVKFGDKAVNAGTYRMYAVPGSSTWQVALNSELGKSGASEPDHSKDVAVIEVPAGTGPETEQFVINFSADTAGVKMDFVWDKTVVTIPITAQ